MKGPLESTKFFVLLALAAGPLHGTRIRQQIMADTLGIYLSDATLYGALASLVRAGLVELVAAGYRKTYRLTNEGQRRLAIEAQRWWRAAELAGQRQGAAASR